MKNNKIFDPFAKENPIIIEGYLLKDETTHPNDSEYLSIQVFPGMVLDIKKQDTSSIEQATDKVTGRTLIKLTLSDNAEVKGLFQLKLARMALSSGKEGIPFSFGQITTNPVYVAVPRSPGQVREGQQTVGETDTLSNNAYSGPGTRDDRTPYTDRDLPDGTTVIYI